MLILGATTSETECSLALWRDGIVLEEKPFQGSRVCVEELIPLVQEILRLQELRLEDIDLFAVDRGPGSLTGIKIGLVAIRTLAQVMDKPVCGISSLHAIACAAPENEDIIFTATHCSAIEIYTGIFGRAAGAGLPEMAAPDMLDSDESAAQRLLESAGERGIFVTGNAVDRLLKQNIFGQKSIDIRTATPELRAPRARHICALAAQSAPSAWSELQANYLCLSNAEQAAAKRAGG